MEKIFWIEKDCVAGRPGPTREPWNLKQIIDEGFNAIINLSEFAPNKEDFSLNGLDVLWVPLPTTVPADIETEEKCVELLPIAYEFLMSHLKKGNHVLVHCVAGRDRTGMLLSYYIARKNLISGKKAIERIREIRPIALASEGWEPMAIRVIDHLCSKRN